MSITDDLKNFYSLVQEKKYELFETTFINLLEKIKKDSFEILDKAKTSNEVKDLKVGLFGKKGSFNDLYKTMGNVLPNDRKQFGNLVNELKVDIEEELDKKEKILIIEERNLKLSSEYIDISLPGDNFYKGSIHPISLIEKEIKNIFRDLGYSVVEGFEVEDDYYNFERLNLPKDHPARDMQDTFYINEDVVLRTHTSPVQARIMDKLCPSLPVKIIAPGKVFRRDDDSTHSPMFHQVEGLIVDENITFGDLRGTLLHFVKRMFGEDREIRLRPSYFPFTEPSAEVDVSCTSCGGSGCRVCGYTGWLEILGSGMVHPKVLKMAGYDPEEVSGFAFGMGIERIAMLKYGIDDIRILYENDIRFLKQF